VSQHELSEEQSPSKVQELPGSTPATSYREILKYITEIGGSLRLHMDVDTLITRVATATCEALRFRYCALYLFDGSGFYRVRAVSEGIDQEDIIYLQQHPVPEAILSRLMQPEYLVSRSYFVPEESPLWLDDEVARHFVIGEVYGQEEDVLPLIGVVETESIPEEWKPLDLMIVPLRRADDSLLGFLTPDSPLDGRRPTLELVELLELFANQVAVVIEGARLYDEARQSSEERAALIEISRSLFAPDALHDTHSVYRTIYAQVCRMMPVDAFFIARYHQASREVIVDYLVDEGISYAPVTLASRPHWVEGLLQKNEGYLFSTFHELNHFLHEAYATSTVLIGNQRPSESMLFVPIHYGEEVIGLLSVQCYIPHAYTERHLAILREIGVQAGIAIMNARLYTELREAVQQAQESEQMKNQFLMTASHELRTPITAIQGYLELLSVHGASLDEARKERFIVNARRASEELILLLSNVMDTSRIDQDRDRVMLKYDAVPVLDAVRVILEILEPSIAREQRCVEVQVPPDLMVWVDDLRLRQVLLNLVGNALKYAPAPAKIMLRAQSIEVSVLQHRLTQIKQKPLTTDTERFILIEVRDWGPGIAPEAQSMLFTKFMRLPGSHTRNQRGAGWGLYLCRELVEAMHGRIWVESTGVVGEGATFFVALPQVVP
jgi:signal transduction histidine kinase